MLRKAFQNQKRYDLPAKWKNLIESILGGNEQTLAKNCINVIQFYAPGGHYFLLTWAQNEKNRRSTRRGLAIPPRSPVHQA